MQSPLDAFRETLLRIQANETNYDVREALVYQALAEAKALKYVAGIRFDTEATDAAQWPVVCIQLPGVGEVSWHSPAYAAAYTGYDTAEKYRRIAAFLTGGK